MWFKKQINFLIECFFWSPVKFVSVSKQNGTESRQQNVWLPSSRGSPGVVTPVWAQKPSDTPLLPLLFLPPASEAERDAAVKLDQERAEIVAKYDKVCPLPLAKIKDTQNGCCSFKLGRSEISQRAPKPMSKLRRHWTTAVACGCFPSAAWRYQPGQTAMLCL